MLRKIIKKIPKVTVAAGVAMAILTSMASATSIKDYPRVAVMNFGNKAITSKGFRDQDFNLCTEYAIYQLQASGWFDLIDYEELNTIAQMHNINNSGLVDPSTIVAMGQFAGAEYMIVGNVTGLTLKENIAGLQVKNAKAGVGEHVVNASVAVRIVDIKTGRIMGAGIGKGSSTSTLTEIGFIKDKWVERAKDRSTTSTIANAIINEYAGNRNSNSGSERNSNRDGSHMDYNNTTIADGGYNDNYNAGSNSSASSNYNNNASSDRTMRDNADSSNRYGESGKQTYDSSQNSNKNISENSNNSGSAHSDSNANSSYYNGSDSIGWDGHLAPGSKTTSYNDGRHYGEMIYDDANGYIHTDSASGNAHSDANSNSSYNNNANYKRNENSSANDNRVATQNSNGYNDSSSSRTMTDSSHANNNGNANYNSNSNEHANANGQYNDRLINNETLNTSNNSSNSNRYNNSSSNDDIYNRNSRETLNTDDTNYTYVKEQEVYGITIGTKQVSEIQVINAISKAIRDAFYGKMGLLTTLNDGKPLNIKTGF